MTAVSQRAIVDRVRQHAVSGVDHRHPLCPDGPNEITVAIEAGVSKQAVYSHFSDNETLFEATVTANPISWSKGCPRRRWPANRCGAD
jgi:hypothetical protein